MTKSESIKNLAIALAKFQGEVSNPSNTATNPFYRSKYAPLSDVLNTVRPILSKHGLSVVQAPSTEGDNITIATTLIHESGEYMEFPPLSLKMDKVTAQGAGSAITYARRYALSAIVGISSEDDDDGNIAETKKETNKRSTMAANANASTIEKNSNLSDKQIKRLYAIANSNGINANTVKAQVQKKFKKKVEHLTRKEYDIVCEGYESIKNKGEFEGTPLQ